MSDRPRLLFIYKSLSSFVEEDFRLLEEQYDVRTFVFDVNRYETPLTRLLGHLYLAVMQFFWLLRELPRAEVAYGWFADYHMALPVLMGRRWGVPVAVALGGFDCNWLPELDYGVFGSAWRAPLARYVHRCASLLLPVSTSLIYSKNSYSSWPEERANGLQAHVGGTIAPVEAIPTGYDPEVWKMGPMDRQEEVRTVALVDSDRTLRLKGIDVLFEVARHLPDVIFEVVGVSEQQQEAAAARYHPPANVRLVGPQPRAALPGIYARTSVYLQLSRAEGMPNVLCEAMLCGCIPVGSSVFGIPDAVGDAGLLIGTPEPEKIVACVRDALGWGADARQRARQQIIEHFTKDQRRRALKTALASLT